MFQIGLTGGIAAGKSVVARRLVELGAILIDSDALAREVVAPGTAGLAAIAEAFGASVIAADGTLDRPALGAIVFSDEAARETLNGITHPAIRARSREIIAGQAPDAVIVNDIPLLVETNQQSKFDSVLVVEAEPATRVDRMTRLRSMDPADAERRIAAQATNAARRAIADVVIDTNGTLEQTRAQVDAYWASLPAPSPS
jgi:dephospho-CoA kinase